MTTETSRKLSVGSIVWLDVYGLGTSDLEAWERHMIAGETPKSFYVFHHRDAKKTLIRKADMTFSLFGDGDRGEVLTHDEYMAMCKADKAASSPPVALPVRLG